MVLNTNIPSVYALKLSYNKSLLHSWRLKKKNTKKMGTNKNVIEQFSSSLQHSKYHKDGAQGERGPGGRGPGAMATPHFC